MTWFDLGLAVAAGLVSLLTPGLIVLAPVRLTVVPRLAVAGIAGIGSAGLAAIVFGAVGLAWSPWQPLVPAIFGAALVAAFTRRTVRTAVPSVSWRDAGLAVALVAVGVVAAATLFWMLPGPDRLSQTYDNVFHMSAIAHILGGGSASPLTLRSLIETGTSFAFYPSAWHVIVASIVEMTAFSPAVAVNAAWVCVVVGIWAPGCAWLAQVLLPGVSAVVALPLSISFGAMPYALLTWGSLYPTFLATALLPAAVAVPLVSTRVIREARSLRQWRATILGVAATSGVVFTLALAQPRILVSWFVLIAPAAAVGVWRVTRRAWRDRRSRRRSRQIASAVGVAAVVIGVISAGAVLAIRLQLFSRPIEDRLSGPQAAASQSVPEAVWSALLQAWPTGVPEIAPWASPVLGVVVIGGLLIAARTRGLRWVAVAYVVVVVLYVLAAGSDSVFAKLATGAWYKDRFRLASVVPVFGVLLATLALTVFARWLARVTRRVWVTRAAAIAGSAIVAGVSIGCLAVPFGSAAAEVLRLPESPERGVVVGAKQMRFLSSIGDVVPADQRVIGDPWDGSAWTQLLGGREPVFPHVNGQWDENRSVLAWNLADIDTDPRVCTALDALRVRYVVTNPHELGGGDPSGNHFPGPGAAVRAGLFTEVLTDGESSLYRIDQCGPLAEEVPTGR